MHDEVNCGCRAKLANRLIEAFEPVDYGTKDAMDVGEAAMWLEVSEEEAKTLMDVGLLKSWDDQVAFADLVAFVEEFDWLRRRAEAQVTHLHSRLEWLQSRAKERAAELEAEASKAHEAADREDAEGQPSTP